jgi:putative intracellular protease/amidase
VTTPARVEEALMSKRIVIVLTSHGTLGSSGKKTGFWFEELAAPYYEFIDAGAHVDLASPQGGRPPADPGSMTNPPAIVKRFLDDPAAVDKLNATRRLTAIYPSDYDAVFVAGGHGVMWDLADDPRAAAFLGEAAQGGKIVAAVCHGPAALVPVKLKNGDSIVKGRRVAAFSNEEEAAVHLTDTVPFALETRLRELGGKYERGPNWSSFVVRDGNLVTGQNPQSSAQTAREVLTALATAEPSASHAEL